MSFIARFSIYFIRIMVVIFMICFADWQNTTGDFVILTGIVTFLLLMYFNPNLNNSFGAFVIAPIVFVLVTVIAKMLYETPLGFIPRFIF